MELVCEVMNYMHFSEEKTWTLTLPQLQLYYFMAMKSKKLQSRMIAASIVAFREG